MSPGPCEIINTVVFSGKDTRKSSPSDLDIRIDSETVLIKMLP